MKRGKTDSERHYIVDILFILALFGVFAVSALMLVTIGANVYQNTVEDMGVNYTTRTATAYITEKIRQNDTVIGEDGSVFNHILVTDIEGVPALKMTQDIDGIYYSTYLYLYDGYLKELLINAEYDLGESAPSAGENIMPLSDFQLTQVQNNLICVTVTATSGESNTIYISTHSTAENIR